MLKEDILNQTQSKMIYL